MIKMFSCSTCLREFPQEVEDQKVIEQFKRWYPKSDIKTAKIVCIHCYQLALRIFEIQTQQENWIKYAMSE